VLFQPVLAPNFHIGFAVIFGAFSSFASAGICREASSGDSADDFQLVVSKEATFLG
jgi:hypothetical protein